MAGRGPAPKPKAARLGHHVDPPSRGEWTAAPGLGWQYGPIPNPPGKLKKASRDAWLTWFSSWVAAHWSPIDLPGLRQLIRVYDQVERYPSRGDLVTQMRQLMDTYGITPKGQQERRWLPPAEAAAAVPTGSLPSPYRDLRVVS